MLFIIQDLSSYNNFIIINYMIELYHVVIFFVLFFLPPVFAIFIVLFVIYSILNVIIFHFE